MGIAIRDASAHQKEWGARLIAELDLGGDEHVLDVGCGDGSLTANLADSVSSVYSNVEL
jgi:ubiquinone/menaquinone biosynthesis C-methylase UbiE